MGPLAVLNNPDVRQLAEIFEELEIDFRIVIMDRSPESLLISTIVNRPYGPNIKLQSQHYTYTLQIILGQLQSLDRRFIVSATSIERSPEENKKALTSFRDFVGVSDSFIEGISNGVRQSAVRCIESSEETDYDENLVQLYRQADKYRKLFLSVFEGHSRSK